MSFDRNMTVLLVDDSKVMRRIIRRHLAGMGITSVYEADSGETALVVLAQENSFRLVYADHAWY